MIRAILVVLVISVCALASVHLGPKDEDLFQEFMEIHGKTYTSPLEFSERFEIFRGNLERVKNVQSQDPSARYGVSPFMDLTPSEFAGAYLMPPMAPQDAKNSCLAHGVTVPLMNTNDLPTSWDWREKGAVTPVKNQGGCGSCWTFSSTGAIEGAWFLGGHPLTSLSEQQLVDCSHDCSNEGDPPFPVCNSGCQGGWPWAAYLTLMNSGGIQSESDYPYKGVDGTCSFDQTKVAAKIANYTCLPEDEDQIAAYLVANGPVSIAMNANSLQFYLGGISDPILCEKKSLDHAILIVGFGTGKDHLGAERNYWIVKNSWGDKWGEKGYFRIIRGRGKCGLNEAVSAVVLHN